MISDLLNSVPIEFVLFGLTLIGIAIFHHHTLGISLGGLGAIIVYKLFFTGFAFGPGLAGLVASIAHEWVALANLLATAHWICIACRLFREQPSAGSCCRNFYRTGGKAALSCSRIVWVFSSFLDNIAGALIGGAMAHQLFRGKVHIGFIAAIVAACQCGRRMECAWAIPPPR